MTYRDQTENSVPHAGSVKIRSNKTLNPGSTHEWKQRIWTTCWFKLNDGNAPPHEKRQRYVVLHLSKILCVSSWAQCITKDDGMTVVLGWDVLGPAVQIYQPRPENKTSNNNQSGVSAEVHLCLSSSRCSDFKEYHIYCLLLFDQTSKT